MAVIRRGRGGAYYVSKQYLLDSITRYEPGATGFRPVIYLGEISKHVSMPIHYNCNGLFRNNLILKSWYSTPTCNFYWVPVIYKNNLYLVLDAPITNEQWNYVVNGTARIDVNLFLIEAETERLRKTPVGYVSFNEAEEYCNRLSLILETDVCLPSSDLWEWFATCGGEYNVEEKITGDTANIDESGRGERTPIKSYSPNNWGLYDCFGNVWESTSTYIDL